MGKYGGQKQIRPTSLLRQIKKVPRCVFDLKLLRTFLIPQQVNDGSIISKPMCDQLISSFQCLRVLDLNSLGVETLPRSIGKLIHLRYFNLSYTNIRKLPSSITDLQNLQTLNLSSCYRLESLPKDIRKLINLRSLDIGYCDHLTHMPPAMGALTSLHKLNFFVVKEEHTSGSRSGQLRDLKNLNCLKGWLEILVDGELKDSLFEAKEANLSSKFGLTELIIVKVGGNDNNYEDRVIKHDEDMLEGLKPHPNLKNLFISGCRGERLPSWAVMDNLSICLPNLVDISFWDLDKWQQLPSLGHLMFLRSLSLRRLERVEYINVSPHSSTNDVELESPPLFFPSLQVLALNFMYGLKGFLKNDMSEEQEEEVGTLPSWMRFSKLSSLWISDCPKLKCIPMCPNVKVIELMGVDEAVSKSLLKMTSERASLDGGGGSSPSSSTSNALQLKELTIDNLQSLMNLQKAGLQHLPILSYIDR